MRAINLSLALAAISLTAAMAPAANATVTKVVPIGTFSTSTSHDYFNISNGADPYTDTDIAANFGDGFSSATSFVDKFEFTIPSTAQGGLGLNGTGSGSISTSFTNKNAELTITKLIIDGTTYTVPSTPNGQSFSTSIPIQITAGMLNTIEVDGTTSTKGGTFSGTATFSAAAVPETATWAMMLAGFGFIGLAMRRRQSKSMTAFA